MKLLKAFMVKSELSEHKGAKYMRGRIWMIETEIKKSENKKIMKKEIITPNSENSLATTQRLVMIHKWLITPKYKIG